MNQSSIPLENVSVSKVSKADIANHRYGKPHAIWDVTLPHGSCDFLAFTPAEAGTRFSNTTWQG